MTSITVRTWSAITVASLLCTAIVYSETKNGFDLERGLIAAEHIFHGGPAKDGIPSIDDPVFVSAEDAGFLIDEDRILGIEINGIAKAYPVNILNWHEIINDAICNTGYTITYCPLCGTGVAFSRHVQGHTLSFGVSGLLYNSDVLLFDRETESLWSQIMGKAITGRFMGTELQMLPLSHTTWHDWKHRHPDSQVLSDNTGYNRNYDRDPYAGYEHSSDIYFPVTSQAPPRYHPKERVLGLSYKGAHKAYPFIELDRNGKAQFNDSLDGRAISIHWNSHDQSGYITDDNGQHIAVMQAYWFAWYAFHPDTQVFTAAGHQ